jgi:replication factor A1
MKIKDINLKSKDVWIQGVITDISPTREFEKFGEIKYVASAVIKDDTGEIRVNLWNEQATAFKKGDILKVDRASVSEWRGALQLNSKHIIKVDKNDLTEEDLDKLYHIKKIEGVSDVQDNLNKY